MHHSIMKGNPGKESGLEGWWKVYTQVMGWEDHQEDS